MNYDIEDLKDIDKIYELYMYALNSKFPLYSWEVSPGTFRISVFNWAGEEIDHTFLGEHAKEHRIVVHFRELLEKVQKEEWAKEESKQ